MIRLLQELSGWKRHGAAMGLGLLAAFAMPPFGLWPALFVAVPLFLVLLEDAEGRSLRHVLLLGWSFGFGYFINAFHWIGFAFLVDAETYLWMMPFMVGGLAAAMAAYWGVAVFLTRLLRPRGLALVLTFAAFLALMENLRGRLFTGFPWAAPGLAIDGMGAMAQGASLIGMTGFTLVILIWAGLPFTLVQRRNRAVALLLLLTMPALYAFGLWRLSAAETAFVPGIALRIVQPNISQDDKWRAENARPIFDKYLSMSAAASTAYPHGMADITHVIWPESAVPFLIDQSEVARRELKRMLNARTALITGAIRRDEGKTGPDGDTAVHNSIIVFDGKAEVTARYDKWRLVPGGEFLPFEWLLEPLGFRRVVTVPGSFAPGPGPSSVDLPAAPPAGMLVCYEAIFPHDLVDPNRRPAWLLNVTNDGWFGQSTGPHQHFAQARLRAIEQGLPLVRAANTGISAVVDPYGRTVAFLGLGQAGTVDAALPAPAAVTPYGALGDFTLLILALICLAASLTMRHGSPRTSPPASLKV